MAYPSEQVQAAMRNAHVKVDERGLMPLALAREIVQGAKEFRKGVGEMIGGTFVLPSDRLWAALLSLHDVDEFVREASRLDWYFHPRGQEDTSALERYGEGILPWLTKFVHEDGRLLNIPWCVVPCLLAMGTQKVFDLIWNVRSVVDGTGTEWPGPFASDNAGDADKREGVNLTGPVPQEPNDDADGLVVDWCSAYPRVGFPSLARLVLDDEDERAEYLLRMVALTHPAEIFSVVRESLGEERAREAFEFADAPTDLEDRCVLFGLHMWSMLGPWPWFGGPEEPAEHPAWPARRAYHALRLVALRATEGEHWGVVFERLEGSDLNSLRVHRFLMSSENGRGHQELGCRFRVDDDDGVPRAAHGWEAVSVHGPKGPMELSDALVSELDLRPDQVTAEGVASSRFSVLVRAYLAKHSKAFWTEPRDIADRLGFDEPWEVVVDTDSFEHALGTSEELPVVIDGYDEKWRENPNQVSSFQSLARAIAERDGQLFDPGEPNTDWREHARYRPEGS